jgi:xylulokinase
MTDVVIGCDIGTQSCKALAMDASGAVLARAAEGYPVTYPHPGWAQQDPNDWERALGVVIGAVAGQVGADRIAAVGISGQVDGIVPVDARGDAVGPGIIWMDRRATAEAASLAARFDARDVHARTGVNIDASHGGPKIAWLRAQERATGSPPADGYLMPVTHAVARLTGERLIDPSSASTTLLWDLHTRDWAEDLMDALDAPVGCLGQVSPASAVAGIMRPDAAASLRLGPGVRVVVGTGDEHAACLAAGALEPGLVCDITGTAEPVAAAAITPLIDPARALETHPHAAPGRWILENPGFVSGGSTRWLADAILGIPERQLFALAADAPVASDGLVFVPALGGAVTPRWNDRARGTFHGLRLGHDRRHLARAVLEGCAFALRDIVDGLDALGLAGDRIRVLGGGARDPLWLAIKSDVTGRTVERLAEPEATAFGAALLAATAMGWYPDAAAAARATATVLPDVDEPDPAHHDRYIEAYQRYRRIFDALEPIEMGSP